MRLQIRVSWMRRALAAMVILPMNSLAAEGQEAAKATVQSEAKTQDQKSKDLQEQMNELKSTVAEMRAEMLRSRAETLELRQELEATRQQLLAAERKSEAPHPTGEAGSPPPVSASATDPAEDQAIQKLEEEQQLTNAKVEELHQAKIESASKYPVRLSGLVLFNLFGNKGVVDNLDFPTLALQESPLARRGSFGGSLRQSLLGLEVFGPRLQGAKVSADLQFDFAGGFPDAPDGVVLGLPRLRTGVVRVEWPSTTLVGGQDVPFFSPLSPSSIASLASPAFAYSGNLWTWTPQVRVEHRVDITSNSSFLFQGGILDSLTGEPPGSSYLRYPEAGEASRQPAYAARTAWSRHVFGRQLTLGIGGYYGRQDWGFHRTVDAWAGTSDWNIPIGNRWDLSGEFYRGRALGGLGGGIGRSVLVSGPIAYPATQVQGLNTTGGWAQLKFRQTEKFEWNGAFGDDNSMARDLRRFPLPQQVYFSPSLARNRGSSLNFIYRPRSDLLISAEYRYLRTVSILGDSEKASQINLSMGVLF